METGHQNESPRKTWGKILITPHSPTTLQPGSDWAFGELVEEAQAQGL